MSTLGALALGFALALDGCGAADPGGSPAQVDATPTERTSAPQPWAGPSTHAYRFEVGELAEVDFRLERGHRATCRFVASAPLLIEAHAHLADGGLVVYARHVIDHGELEIEAPHDGLFSFLWAHAADAGEVVRMTAVLDGEAREVTWLPDGDRAALAPASGTADEGLSAPGARSAAGATGR